MKKTVLKKCILKKKNGIKIIQKILVEEKVVFYLGNLFEKVGVNISSVTGDISR